MKVNVKFLGGAESVTGSRYLLEIGDFRILFDCGIFQGLKELRLRNWDPFPVDQASIDAVIISHAHIDHTGYLPRLVAQGYNGKVYCTYPTGDLMEIMLMDSAKLQEEEASYARKKGYSKHADPQPLYNTDDVKQALRLLERHNFNETIHISRDIRIVFRNAGHLLGAAITEIIIKGDTQEKKIVFSGDLGRQNDVMLFPPAEVKEADVLFIESTYGNTSNPGVDPSEVLAGIINRTFQRGGVVLIPAFAVGRTQTLLYYLHTLMEANAIPDVPVYIDSPMATSATYLYYKYPAYHQVDFHGSEFSQKLETNLLVFVKSVEHSKSLNDVKRPAVIISSSGMMTGGRILHHLYRHLPNEEDTVIISGYQAEGTRGRKLADKAATLRIFGEEIPVRCQVENLKFFSGHADREELFKWMSAFTKPPKFVFTVHGEGDNLKAYTGLIREKLKWNVIQPKYLESVMLFDGI